jgi:hypothetical protein
MNEDAVWATLANEIEEGGPMSAFIERLGAKPVDRPIRRTPCRLDSGQRAALLKGLRTRP